MIKTYQFDVYTINVSIEHQLVRINSNATLWGFLGNKVRSNLFLLICKIKADYQDIFNKPLNISAYSLLVEIGTHIQCHRIGLKFNRCIKISWINKFVNKLIKRAAVVDCGEQQVDGNRWFWDFLARHKSFALKFMPKKLSATTFELH